MALGFDAYVLSLTSTHFDVSCVSMSGGLCWSESLGIGREASMLNAAQSSTLAFTGWQTDDVGRTCL